MRRNHLALLVLGSALLAAALPLTVDAQRGRRARGRRARQQTEQQAQPTKQASADDADDTPAAQTTTANAPLPASIPRATAGVCVGPEARQNVERCPSGAPPPAKRAGANRPGG